MTQALVLHVKVGEPPGAALARAKEAMKTLARGGRPQPHFGVGFASMPQLLAVFTPKRWELIAALRASGPTTIAELARRLGRDYKNVHSDVAQLIEWMAVERTADGKVAVPWREIVVDLKLPEAKAA